MPGVSRGLFGLWLRPWPWPWLWLWLWLAVTPNVATAADGGPAPPGCGAVTIKGCCAGEVLRYCQSGALRSEDCAGKPSCGWRAELNYYACASGGGSDPSGKHAKVCPTANADAGVDRAVPPPADRGVSDVAGPTTDGARDAFIWRPADSGPPPSDGAADARRPQPTSDPGCGCRAGGEGPTVSLAWLLLGIFVWSRRARGSQP